MKHSETAVLSYTFCFQYYPQRIFYSCFLQNEGSLSVALNFYFGAKVTYESVAYEKVL